METSMKSNGHYEDPRLHESRFEGTEEEEEEEEEEEVAERGHRRRQCSAPVQVGSRPTLRAHT